MAKLARNRTVSTWQHYSLLFLTLDVLRSCLCFAMYIRWQTAPGECWPGNSRHPSADSAGSVIEKWPNSEVSDVLLAAGVRVYDRGTWGSGRLVLKLISQLAFILLSRRISVIMKRGRQKKFCIRYGSKLTTYCLTKCMGFLTKNRHAKIWSCIYSFYHILFCLQCIFLQIQAKFKIIQELIAKIPWIRLKKWMICLKLLFSCGAFDMCHSEG